MTTKLVYEGGLRCVATHIKSGTIIETDAPVDNHGRGERFSPTDLVAAALASCMLTLMGIAGRKHNINIDGTECEVEKIMIADPMRRIGELKVNVNFPKTTDYSDEEKKILEYAAITCPVYLSLHEMTKKTVSFNWK